MQKLRIACDVMGTLRGDKGKIIAEGLKQLQKMGHIIVIWSNEYTLARDEAKSQGFSVDTACQKFTKADASEYGEIIFDVAIEDDHMQTKYLGAKKFVMVHDFNTVTELINLVLN